MTIVSGPCRQTNFTGAASSRRENRGRKWAWTRNSYCPAAGGLKTAPVHACSGSACASAKLKQVNAEGRFHTGWVRAYSGGGPNGCGVGPGVGSLASLVLVFVALAVVMRKSRGRQDR